MPSHYSGFGAAAVGTDKTILALLASATVRPALKSFVLSFGGTVGDVATILKLMRLTAVGTEGNGFTPIALDPADPAAIADYAAAHSVEPTYTANTELWDGALNQRATFRHVCEPGAEFIAPATANNGIGMKSSSSTGTPTGRCSMIHFE